MRNGDASVQEELLLLYEPLLSIGHSPDARANCRGFLQSLVSKRNLTGAPIWWRSPNATDVADATDAAPSCELLAAIPRRHVEREQLPADHPLCHLARAGVARTFAADDADAPDLRALDFDRALELQQQLAGELSQPR